MCGIVGFAGFRDPDLLERMCQSIYHRGPDGQGMSESLSALMSVGMRRLSIIDIEGGTQPFFSHEKKVQLVFNGEIYNHNELRQELQAIGFKFNSRSDTEVVLNAYLAWGTKAWTKLNGMFVFAIIDSRGEEDEMLIVRDRTGIKPLFYTHKDGKLVFGSELKALLEWPQFPKDINLKAINHYLSTRYVPGPGSMFTGVEKLAPGHQLNYKKSKIVLSQWWTPPEPGVADDTLTRDEALELFGNALRNSVNRHMIADVEVGAYLSGGVDSTVIAALMAQSSTRKIHTFSVGFPNYHGNELLQAEATAEHIGSIHQSIECRETDLKSLPDIVKYLDEPLGDAIVLPMYVLAREARKTVKVVQSGEGADEILGGYLFHRKLVALQKLRVFMPDWCWPFLASLLSCIPLSVFEKHFDYPDRLGKVGKNKLISFFRDVPRYDLVGLKKRLISLFDPLDINAISLLNELKHPSPDLPSVKYHQGTTLQKLVRAGFDDWLPDEILSKLDRMTMAHSLEGRVPFLDAEVISAASKIPDAYKLSGNSNKLVLRDFARTILPTHLLDRPKVPFYTPLESYSKSPYFKDLLAMTIDPVRLRKRGLFKPEDVAKLYNAPANAGFLPLKRLFAIMMLELWFESYCPDASW